MWPTNPLAFIPLSDWLETLLPDLVLSFLFFTSVLYVGLGRRFAEHRRATGLASAALGIALSVGLVWWEQQHGVSIRDLGPIAVGFAILLLGFVMHHAVRLVGGTFAGAFLSLGAAMVMAWLFGARWHVDSGIVGAATFVILFVGMIAFVMHQRRTSPSFARGPADLPQVRHDMSDLYQDRRVGRRLGRGLRRLRKGVGSLFERPEGVDDTLLQIRRMLPAEGWLTERLARLRNSAYRIRMGHVARIEQIEASMSNLPADGKRAASEELKARYRELKFDERLERLDKAVAAYEMRIRSLLQLAQTQTASHEFAALSKTLEDAAKLQRHNAKLFAIIERTERRLHGVARQIAQKQEVSDA